VPRALTLHLVLGPDSGGRNLSHDGRIRSPVALLGRRIAVITRLYARGKLLVYRRTKGGRIMSVPVLSLIALLIAIVISCLTP